MQLSHFRPIRGHGRVPQVVVVLLAALVSLTWPVGARGAPVAPVPMGVWPLQPRPSVVRAFDPPDLPFGSGHRGVDLAGSPGQLVHAALPGRVTYAGPLAGRGVVVVDHGDTRTTYEPVSASVHVGDVVLGGQPLGALELAGSHCFPQACLHWGWLRGDTYLDPLLLVGVGPIRLLPLWIPAGEQPGARWLPPAQPYAGVVAGLAVPLGVRPHGRVSLLPWARAPARVRTVAVPRSWARPVLT
ncbi:murein hydrolase activator EnvC family protein [Nocardioides cynanchi]|uniref:murein hydrolase activator EnvC family protein n=1 Tax=Nocardioides cynanchi TaxID=2558918 RepID=UPI00192D9BBF|nr:M23 family metallopeptidase [Nocardioides cynanchi]